MAQDDLVPCSGFGGFGRPWTIGGEKGERWLLLSTTSTTTSRQTLEKQWQQNWRQTHVIAMSSPVTIHRQVCVCVGGGHSRCILCVGDILDVFCVWGTFWVYSHQFPFSDHLIHTPFAFYWLDIDNALVLICFQLDLYVFMCQIKTCREIDGCFCDFSVYFPDLIVYFCDLALTSVKRNSVLQLSVSTVSWVTISEEERGIGEERFRISSQGNQYNCKLSAVHHGYKCGYSWK